MTFVNVRRALKPHTLYKFHFHESTIFSTIPQTRVINNVVLKNKKAEIIEQKQGEALQKSFDTVISNKDGSVDSTWGTASYMNKLYAQIYHPFLTKAQLSAYFKEPTSNNLSALKSFVMRHIRLNDSAISALEFIYQKPSFDFGILRGSYFASLGIVDDYGKLLHNANSKLFRNHMHRDVNYSSPLSSNNFKKNEEILLGYLKQSSQLHHGVSNLKNFLVVDNPNQSEFFISMAAKLGVNVIVLTESNFASPSSTINHLFQRYQMYRSQRDLFKCHEIHSQLSNMKLISMKSMKELMTFLDILQDPYLRLYQLNALNAGTSMNSFDKRLLEMELSILGDIETKSIRTR